MSNTAARVVLTAMIVTLVLVGAMAGNFTNYKMLWECQRELPRNQHCELVAVPRVEQEGE